MCHFSIIVPVYNVAAELPRTVKSVQMQDFTDWEIVLVDDGSTDDSGVICDQLAAADIRIKVVHQPNQGVVAARQNGFEASSGSWILFLDGDDELEPSALGKIAAAIGQSSCDIVQYGFKMIVDGCESFDESKERIGLKTIRWVLEHAPRTPLDILGMCIWNKCYRREVAARAFADVGDVRISHSEDGLYAFAAFLHVQSIMFLEEPLYRYILRKTSAVHRVNEAVVWEKVLFLDRMQKLAEQSGLMSAEQIRRMIDFHSYQACCYTFLMLKRNHAPWGVVRRVLGEMSHSAFYLRPNKEVNSFKRKLMYALIRCPWLYYAAAKLGIVR